MINIKLSIRLKAIADLVEDNILFDCGSDHAYLPCFLVMENKIKKAYAADLRELPLAHAIKTINKYDLRGKVIPLLSDGLDNLAADCDCITIAGMGDDTILNILKKADLSNIKHVIVQANKGTTQIRKYLNNRYMITNEKIVKDNNHFYEILAFNPQLSSINYNYEDLLFGPVNRKNKDIIFQEFWTKELAKLIKIYSFNSSIEINKKIKAIKAELNIK